MEKYFETSCTNNILYPNRLIVSNWKLKKYHSLEQVKNHIFVLKQNIGKGKFFFLSDITAVKSVSKPVREYLASEVVDTICAAHAIYTNSAITRMIGNLFIKFNKPVYPNQLFTNKDTAHEWLLKQMHST
ncbi:MAG: STAS/SEC14 domain-containing protein [Saprospiraceae bacterium]|nr:STAS/SEC14 domain-containing protein [Saprospiraceae bacterium]